MHHVYTVQVGQPLDVLNKEGHTFFLKTINGVIVEWLRAPNSSSAVSVQQSVGSNPSRDTSVPEQET